MAASKSKYVRNTLIAGLILAAVGLLGMAQGVVLQYDVIETTTTSPDPATGITILGVAVLVFCAGTIAIVALSRRKR